MAAWANIFNGAVNLLIGAHGPVHLPQQQTSSNPMQSVIDGYCATQPAANTPCSLDELIDRGLNAECSYEEIGNLEHVYAPTFTLEVTASGIDRLREGLGNSPEHPLKATGAQMGWEFNPCHTINNVEASLGAIEGPTHMENAVFYSAAPSENGKQNPLDIANIHGVNLDGFHIRPYTEGASANHVSLNLEHTSAKDGHFVGNNNRLTAKNSDISGLHAEGSRVLALEVSASTAHDMRLSHTSLAPGSAIESSYLSGAMHDCIVGDLSLQNSYLLSDNMFRDTDISGVNFEGAIPSSKAVFEGAVYEGQQLTDAALDDFWQAKSPSFGTVGARIASPAIETAAAQPASNLGDLGSLSDRLAAALQAAAPLRDHACVCDGTVPEASSVLLENAINTHMPEGRGAQKGDLASDPSMRA